MLATGSLPEDLTSQQYTDYYFGIAQLENLSESTFKLARYAVASYFDCFNPARIPAASPKRFKPKHAPVVPSEEEIRRILPGTGDDLRAKAALAVLIGLGLRKSEALNLELGRVDFDRMEVTEFNGKGARDRVPPMDQVTAQVLKAYKEKANPGLRTYLLGSAPGKKLTPYCLEKSLARTCEAGGVVKHITLHSMRHYFTSHIILGWP